MRIILLIGISLFTLSCSVKKDNVKVDTVIAEQSGISETEKDMLNSFLDIELKKDAYKYYNEYSICIIKEEMGKLHPLNIYEYCYNDRKLPIKNSTNKEWILNEVQIKKLKEEIKNDKIYYWRATDFTVSNVCILESSELIKSIKESTYTNLPKRLIVYLSKPLLIDNNNAFISIRTGDSFLGFKTISSFTALLKKNLNEKWEVDSYYYDPNSTW